ncbi:MAG: hypothetical protein Q9165_003226 [Trypethelium subeluteriae]
MGGWVLHLGPDLAIPTKEEAESTEAAEQLSKQVDARERLEMKMDTRAATMPNLSSQNIKLEPGLHHANTDSISYKKPSLLTLFERGVSSAGLPSDDRSIDGDVDTVDGDVLESQIRIFKQTVSSLGDVLWNRNEHLNALVRQIEIPRSDMMRYQHSWLKSLTILQTDTWPLDAEQIYLCREMGLIRQLPDLSEDEIEDRSKSDFLVEAIAIVQLLWFCIQLLGRVVKNLAITQFEIFTFAFATCSSLTYLLQLQKPKDITRPHYLSAVRYPTSKEMCTIVRRGSLEYAAVSVGRSIKDTGLSGTKCFYDNLEYEHTAYRLKNDKLWD